MNLADGRSRPTLKVLIVDDSADTATLLATLLTYEGHDVQQACDGDAAIDAVHLCWPDVVLLDLAMPGCNGYEVARRIREQRGEKPKPLFIVISGYASPADLSRSEAEGIYLHLAKPTEPGLLCGRLRDIAVNRSGCQLIGTAPTCWE
jgi:CheY-like chemotaxis protein